MKTSRFTIQIQDSLRVPFHQLLFRRLLQLLRLHLDRTTVYEHDPQIFETPNPAKFGLALWNLSAVSFPLQSACTRHSIPSTSLMLATMSATESIRKTPSETGARPQSPMIHSPDHTTDSSPEIANTLSQLKLSTTVPQKPLHKPKSKPVADSWDLESSGSDTETETGTGTGTGTSPAPLSTSSSITTTSDELPPHPPPPTPASPTPFDFPDNSPYGAGRSRLDSGVSASDPGRLDKRPEKTTAVSTLR